MSFRSKQECKEASISTTKQSLDEKDGEQLCIQEKTMIQFYFLLLIQALIILVSYFIQMEDLFFYKTLGAKSSSGAFQEYCNNTNYCQKNILNQDNKRVQYQIWNYWPNQYHWLSLVAYPLFLLFQQSIRNIIWLRKIAVLLTLISYPCLFLFVQILLIYIRKYFENYIEQLQIIFWIYLANIVLFIINQSIQNVQEQQDVKKQQNEKIIYTAFLAFTVNIIYNWMSETSTYWTLYILAIVYILTYFIHIDANLFQDNKYISEDKKLIRIIIEKLIEPLQAEDGYRNVIEHHFVLDKNYTIIYTIIVILLYWPLYIYDQESILMILISIILISVLWDTSLVSTTTKFTLDDQWLASNLFFLDFFLPIRNILILLLLD